MTINDLLEMLDIEDGSQFEYFECMSDLVEAEDEIDADVMYHNFRGATPSIEPVLKNRGLK